MGKKEEAANVLKGQPCPMCREKTLTLTEAETEVPFFGKIYVFSMKCESCQFFKSDVEAAEQKEPCRCTIEIQGKDDLNIRVVKSAEATVKIPHLGSIEPGPASQGYVTNVEGIITKIKEQIEFIKNNEEDDEDARKKAKNLLKKIQKVLWGEEKLKIIIEDPTGNSAIISEKAERKKL